MTAARPKTQSATLTGFRGIYTGTYYQGEKGQTPVNSLSTFICDERKGLQILVAYAKKYSQNPEGLLDFIESLKGGESL